MSRRLPQATAASQESWRNFREWVATALNVFLAPDGLVATDETIDTFAQVLECRAKELAVNSHADLLEALKAVESHHVALNARAGRDESRSATLRLVRSAIAKAEGRS